MRIFKFLYIHFDIESGFIKLFNKGFAWKNTLKYPLLFSERNGYTKGVKIGRMYFNFLSYKINK